MKNNRTKQSIVRIRNAAPTQSQILSKLLPVMKRHGLEPIDPKAIRADGIMRRYRIAMDQGKDSSAWCRVYGDRFPIAVFGSHRTGDSHKWCFRKSAHMSTSKRNKINVQLTQALKMSISAIEAEKSARMLAIKTFVAAKKASTDNPYLKAKAIGSHGLRLKDGCLLIPWRNAKGKLQSYQTIAQNGVKRWLKGGRKQGCFHILGGDVQHRVFITEGYATAATIYELTGVTTYMAGDSGNLRNVAITVRANHPVAEIVLMADNDWEKFPTLDRNVGITKARDAAAAINGRVAIPEFDKSDIGASDFNDLYRLRGKKAVLKAIAAAKTVPPDGGMEAFAMDAKHFLKLPLKKPELIIAPWLRTGGLCMIHGWTGIGKTLLRDAMAAHLRVGQDLLCWHISRPVSVLIVDGEMPIADVQVRLDAAMKSVGKKSGAPLRILTNDQVTGGPIDLRESKWQELIEREAAGSEVIFLDNVATLAGDTADFNDAKSWTPIQRWMTKMRAKGHAIIWFHNDGKGGSQLGTATREIVLDVSIQLSAVSPGKVNGSSFKIKYTKPRWVFGEAKRPFKVVVETDPTDGTLDWTWKSVQSDDERAAKAKATKKLKPKVLKLREAGKSIREIEEELGVPRATVDRWVNEAKNPTTGKSSKKSSGKSSD